MLFQCQNRTLPSERMKSWDIWLGEYSQIFLQRKTLPIEWTTVPMKRLISESFKRSSPAHDSYDSSWDLCSWFINVLSNENDPKICVHHTCVYMSTNVHLCVSPLESQEFLNFCAFRHPSGPLSVLTFQTHSLTIPLNGHLWRKLFRNSSPFALTLCRTPPISKDSMPHHHHEPWGVFSVSSSVRPWGFGTTNMISWLVINRIYPTRMTWLHIFKWPGIPTAKPTHLRHVWEHHRSPWAPGCSDRSIFIVRQLLGHSLMERLLHPSKVVWLKLNVWCFFLKKIGKFWWILYFNHQKRPHHLSHTPPPGPSQTQTTPAGAGPQKHRQVRRLRPRVQNSQNRPLRAIGSFWNDPGILVFWCFLQPRALGSCVSFGKCCC